MPFRLSLAGRALALALIGVGAVAAGPVAAASCDKPTPNPSPTSPSPSPSPSPSDGGEGGGGDLPPGDVIRKPASSLAQPVVVDCTHTPTPTPSPSPTEKPRKKKHKHKHHKDDPTPSPVIIAPAPTPSPTTAAPTTPPPTEEPTAAPPSHEPPPLTRPTASEERFHHSSPLLALLIVGAVLMSLARNGGVAARSRHVALVADRDDSSDARHVASRDAVGIGDRSFTWRFPGYGVTDAASVSIPAGLARFSPLLSRITEDGSEFRAILGLLWIAAPAAGLALGLAAAHSTDMRAVPPLLAILIAGAVLASFDALAGTIAAIAFAATAIASGALLKAAHPINGVLVLIVVGFLWMAIPLIGSAIRPLRRVGDQSLRHTWDRFADVAIASLLCGWVAQKLAQAMDLFAGQKTGVPAHANLIALIVMAAVGLRIVIEHVALSLYPQRLRTVEVQDDLGEPPLFFRVGGALARTAVFAFIGFAFIGACWQWWAGSALFLVSQLLGYLRQQVKSIRFIHRLLPRGIAEILVLVASCTLLARYAMHHAASEPAGLKLAFLLMVIPPTILSVASLFADDETSKTSWRGEIIGAALLAVTVVLALHGWDY